MVGSAFNWVVDAGAATVFPSFRDRKKSPTTEYYGRHRRRIDAGVGCSIWLRFGRSGVRIRGAQHFAV
jgi:hypothetical protein